MPQSQYALKYIDPLPVPTKPISSGVPEAELAQVTASPYQAAPTETLMPSPANTQTPAPETTAAFEPKSTPSPKPVPTAAYEPTNWLKGKVIGIDPGHQLHANSEQEPISPDSSKTKKKVSSGTRGIWSRVPEHEVNLAVALLVRDMLENAGATVVMIRETADVDISNIERAKLFNKFEVDIAVRLHCNGSENRAKQGAFVLVPPETHINYTESERAAELVLESYGEITGLSTDSGIIIRSDQTGFTGVSGRLSIWKWGI